MNIFQTPSGPFVLVIYGATGDLAQKKLFPALYSLFKTKQFGEQFYIVGFSRRDLGDISFRNFLSEELASHTTDPEWQAFLDHIYYQQGFFDDQIGYEQLITKLADLDTQVGACITRIFYLATPPDNYLPILHLLSSTKLAEGCGQGSNKWTKLVIEKPFGKDLATARQIDQKLSSIFEEKQIFRVDHYLAKETIQNILAFRFANGIFEPVWNKEYIDHIQITWVEQEGIRNRGAFFDGIGILRDVGQNHLLQMLASVIMEQPKSFTKESVRDERAAAIKALQLIQPDEVATSIVRGQYKSYTEEKNIPPDSQTETYVAMKLFVDTPRFKEVPVYVRVGKRLAKEKMEISVIFKQTCHLLFKEYGCPEIGNVLTFRIQPDEGIKLRVIAKTPGLNLSLETIDMKFSYGEHRDHVIADAYEKVLLDIFSGDQMLFNRSDELASSWEFISNVLAGWNTTNAPLYRYEDLSEGPEEAEKLLEKDGRRWL